jgi:very-short-patch-repair endonuclease
LFPDTLHRAKIAKREIDVFLPKLRVGVEIDGYFHKGKQAKDRQKNSELTAAGVRLIRVRDTKLGRLTPNDVVLPPQAELSLADTKAIVAAIEKLVSQEVPKKNRLRLQKYASATTFVNKTEYEKLVAAMPGPLPERSLLSVSPDLAAEWNEERNGRLTPSSVAAWTSRKVWWRCQVGHEWSASPKHRFNKGQKIIQCPTCSKAPKSARRFEESLAGKFPEIAREWHPTKNIGLDPTKLLPFSSRSAWWICPRGHEYSSVIANRTAQAHGCGYCRGSRVDATNSLAALYPELLKEWLYEKNGDVDPLALHSGSGKRVWWECANGHRYQASVKSRTRLKSGCARCYHDGRRIRE